MYYWQKSVQSKENEFLDYIMRVQIHIKKFTIL